ncbi:MAG TPA: O-antigen ligase family protein, partial [Gemmatimonadales bacterium]
AIRAAAVAAFAASWMSARRWPSIAPAVVLAVLPLGPALLTMIFRVAALNVFYTLLLAAVLGSLLPRLPFDRWALPRWWAILLGTWALTLALGWPVMIVREAGLRLGTLRDVGALDSWAYLTTPQVESWILYVAITQLVGVLFLDWLFATGFGTRDSGFASDPGSRIPDPVHGLWLGTTAASIVAIYQGTVDVSFLSGGPWPGLQRAAGTLLDANAYGTIAAFAGPIAFVSIPSLHLRHTRSTQPHSTHFARSGQAAALAINWAGAWMSGSRTALVCGVLGTVLLVYELLRARQTGANARGTSSLLAATAAVVLVLIGAASAVGPFKRIASGAALTPGDLWTRGGYGTVAVRMIRDYPLTGVGIGSYNWMASDYWRVIANDRLPFDNAQNWWRHQVVELGVVGALPVIAWSLLVAWLVFTRRTPPANRIETATIRGLLIGLGIASMLGVPTQNPIALLIFFYLVARFENLTNAQRIADPGSRIPAAAWTAAALIAVIYASGQLVLARGPLKPLERAERTNRDYIIGTYPGEPLETGYFRWTRKRATFALAAPSRFLVLRYHVEHPDIGTHPVKVRITTACQTLVDEFLTEPSLDARNYELPDGQSRVVFETEVSRTWRPADFGKSDRRELGLAVQADFVGTRDVVTSQGRWIPLQRCPPV